MKRNDRFFLKNVGDTWFLQCSEMSEQKLIFLNETGVFLWEKLMECETKEDLVNELVASYDVHRSLAEEDVKGFLAFLAENGCLIQKGVSD